MVCELGFRLERKEGGYYPKGVENQLDHSTNSTFRTKRNTVSIDGPNEHDGSM
jgi:hypothetical protein